MAGGALIVGACLFSALAEWDVATAAAARLADVGAALDARVSLARRGLAKGGGGPAVAMLGLLSPAAVDAIDALAEYGSEL